MYQRHQKQYQKHQLHKRCKEIRAWLKKRNLPFHPSSPLVMMLLRATELPSGDEELYRHLANQTTEEGGHMEDWLKVAEAAEETGIPARTIHRYIKRHPDFLPTREEHRTKMLRREDVPVLLRIRHLYQDGNTQEGVEGLLDEEEDVTRTLTVQEEADDLPDVVGLLQSMAAEQQRLADRVEELTEQMEKERELREKRQEDRDKALVDTIRRVMEEKPSNTLMGRLSDFWQQLTGKTPDSD